MMTGQGLVRPAAHRARTRPLTRQERATLCPGDRSSGPAARNPAPEAPAGEGGESREGKPLWKLRCRLLQAIQQAKQDTQRTTFEVVRI